MSKNKQKRIFKKSFKPSTKDSQSNIKRLTKVIIATMGKFKKNLDKKKKKPIDIIRLSNERIDYYDVTTQYVKWYNREINQIFNDIQCVTPRLHSSNVHINSLYRYQTRDDVDEENEGEVLEIGSLWTSIEKRKFFRLLSRYSIHRFDDWYPLFNGTKSKQEILTYYEVLNKNLKLMKEKNPNTLLRYDDYPIAYEVNDNFIEFEEHMSLRLMEREKLPYFCDDPEEFVDPVKDGDRLIDVSKWNRRWHWLYRHSILKEEVDTTHPERINNEEDYRDDNLYELNQEVGNKYIISQYEPVDPELLPTDSKRSLTQIPKLALPFSKEAMSYLNDCVRNYIRDLLYYCVLPKINERSIPNSKVKRVYQISKRTNMKKALNNKHKNDMSVSDSIHYELVVKHSTDKIAYPHIITEDEINNGIMLMRREGKYVKTKSLSVIDTINKFEFECESEEAFKERLFLQSLIPQIIYDKLNHPIPLVNNNKSYETISKFDRVLQEPIDQELKIICGLLPRHKGDITSTDPHFQIINDNIKYFGWNNINQILNLRLDNPLELELLDRETKRLEDKDMHESRQYLDSVYHYFGTILNVTQPGLTMTKKRGDDILNGYHVIVEDSRETRDSQEEEEQEEEVPILWPNVAKTFEKINY